LIANLVDTLHDLGRPVSANRLLAALGTGPPELTVELVQTFAVSGRRRDVTTLLDSVLRADADHQASLIATWVFGSWGPRVISGMRTAVRHFIQQQFANPKTLLTMLTLEIGTDELVVELLDTMFPDFNKAISGYQVLDGTPGCEHIADQLLSRQRDKVVGMDTAIDLSLALVSAKDAQLGKRFALKGLSVPDRPGPLDPPQNLMIAYRVVRGTSVVSAPSETQQIGAQFLDEHIVAVLAVLRTRDLARTRKLLHVVAQHRPVEAVPSAIAALEAAGLTREMKILMQALRERPKRDVRRLARLLKESHPDLATELLTTS
jgi:hypothetical protein